MIEKTKLNEAKVKCQVPPAGSRCVKEKEVLQVGTWCCPWNIAATEMLKNQVQQLCNQDEAETPRSRCTRSRGNPTHSQWTSTQRSSTSLMETFLHSILPRFKVLQTNFKFYTIKLSISLRTQLTDLTARSKWLQTMLRGQCQHFPPVFGHQSDQFEANPAQKCNM